MLNTITDIEGIKVGHATDEKARTGCTVLLCEKGFRASCEVRGGAPGTREIALLKPTAKMDEVHAILLSGGSAFGLQAAGGVMKYLEEKNTGFPTGVTRVPIVPAAIIFDLAYGNADIRPGPEMGYKASANAISGAFNTGSVGVGTGATVGKILGMDHCMKSGVGTASIKKGDLIVGALAVCNAFGDIINPDSGDIIAGACNDNNEFINSVEYYMNQKFQQGFTGQNTTLVVVATNANISKSESKKVASMAHDGIARSIAPVHTMFDGDIVFNLNNNKIDNIEVGILGTMAAEVTAKAILNTVKNITD
ncbi:MAG: P1 family peptidase [Halanaerobiaceae bacterium]